MNRTLKRPMFRTGGSAEGITSGLAPRQGYNEGLRSQKIRDILSGGMTIGQAQDLSKEFAYKPRGTNVYDFLTEFGLDIASRPPVPGGILATAATAAKEPYQRFMQRKGEADVQRYASESDMFKTLIEGAAEATGEEGLAGKTAQWKSEMVPVYLNTIATIGAVPEGERTQQQKIDLEAATINLDNLKEDSPYISFFLDNPKLGEALVKKIKPKLLSDDQKLSENQRKYDPELGEDDPKLITDSFREFRRQVREMRATGGRVGYQEAGPVMGQPTQADAMPEELGGVSYEELRARLPQDVSDEVVRLLANSPEALEDFAVIQTEQDIANFNKKYGVNLVLPAEA